MAPSSGGAALHDELCNTLTEWQAGGCTISDIQQSARKEPCSLWFTRKALIQHIRYERFKQLSFPRSLFSGDLLEQHSHVREASQTQTPFFRR
jgi:hypothetical protein